MAVCYNHVRILATFKPYDQHQESYKSQARALFYSSKVRPQFGWIVFWPGFGLMKSQRGLLFQTFEDLASEINFLPQQVFCHCFWVFSIVESWYIRYNQHISNNTLGVVQPIFSQCYISIAPENIREVFWLMGYGNGTLA